MLLSVLSAIHMVTTLLFGVYISASILGILMNRKNILCLLAFSAIAGLCSAASYLFLGNAQAEQLYPFLIHLPLILFFTLFYHCSLILSGIAVFTAYLCCQISNWIGIAARELSGQLWVYYVVRIGITLVIFVFLFRYMPQIMRRLTQKSTKIQLIFGLVPFVYYLFDYVTSVYTSLLYSGRAVVAEFLGFILCISYLMFLCLYFRQYEENLEEKQRYSLLEMKRSQSEKELIALQRSRQTISLMRHDLRHYLAGISALLENGETQKAREFIQEILQTSDRTILKSYSRNETVNPILSFQEDTVSSQKIQLITTLELPEVLPVSDVDLTTILSNALENAIHATSMLPETDRKIQLSMRIANDKLLLSIQNPFLVRPEIVDGLPQTSKKGHGLGTRSIWYTVERLHGNCQFSVEGEEFILRIILPLHNPD